MKSIRILHLITVLEPGGAETQLMRVLRTINSEKYQSYVAFILGKGTLAEEFLRAGIIVIDLTRNAKFSLLSVTKLYRLLKKYKIDVLHTHLVHASLLGRIVGTLARVPVLISTRHFGYETKEHTLIYYLERKTAFLDKRIIAVSSAVKNYLLASHPKLESKITVIHNSLAINDDHKEISYNNSDPQKCTIISVGNLKKIKRFDILIESLKLVEKEYKDFVALIVGEGSERCQLEILVNKSSLNERVFFLGQKSNPEIITLLDKCQIYVQSSMWESFGIAILEAMHKAKPVIASDVGGIPELITNGYNGILVPPEDPPKLAEAILKLITDGKLRERLGQNARETVIKNFSLDKAVKEHESLYEELLMQS